jgi:hypothetical protein
MTRIDSGAREHRLASSRPTPHVSSIVTMLELSKKSPSTAAEEIRQGASAYGH